MFGLTYNNVCAKSIHFIVKPSGYYSHNRCAIICISLSMPLATLCMYIDVYFSSCFLVVTACVVCCMGTECLHSFHYFTLSFGTQYVLKCIKSKSLYIFSMKHAGTALPGLSCPSCHNMLAKRSTLAFLLHLTFYERPEVI